MPNFQTNSHFDYDSQKVNQHTRGKWLNHVTTVSRKENQLQNINHVRRLSFLKSLQKKVEVKI